MHLQQLQQLQFLKERFAVLTRLCREFLRVELIYISTPLFFKKKWRKLVQ
jgi:hypothetical protein